MFLASIAVWFATGNVVLPIAVWLMTALAASGFASLGGASGNPWPPAGPVVLSLAALALVSGLAAAFVAGCRGLRRRGRLNAYLRSAEMTGARTGVHLTPADDGLSREDLQLMRLLLDRALQPVDTFEGFHWIDQFQTAAVRYQLNFIAYALSIARAVHFPAFHGYFDAAQENLIAKQQDHRVWRYWRLENLWGNLRPQADPIPRDNIMFTGFLAAQIAYHQGATGRRPFDAPGSLAFEHPSGERYAYSLPALIDVLRRQYAAAAFGFLACEPNWIYPLCNAISASAIRAHDTANGTAHWESMESAFRHALEAEFITAGGRLVPFRSSVTGVAPPLVGGAVMQAFPCFFLNALLPDIAQRQWLVLRHDLRDRDWRRALWPVDVGNYRFSRASSYAATAAAAVELGDGDVATRLLDHLDDDCPRRVSANVAHRPQASLWAHAVELIARCGRANALRTLITAPRSSSASGPFIKDADYSDLLAAKAINGEGALFAVLYPGQEPGVKPLTIGGLVPNRSYVAAAPTGCRFQADGAGEARLRLPVDGRTELRITPAA